MNLMISRCVASGGRARVDLRRMSRRTKPSYHCVDSLFRNITPYHQANPFHPLERLLLDHPRFFLLSFLARSPLAFIYWWEQTLLSKFILFLSFLANDMRRRVPDDVEQVLDEIRRELGIDQQRRRSCESVDRWRYGGRYWVSGRGGAARGSIGHDVWEVKRRGEMGRRSWFASCVKWG